MKIVLAKKIGTVKVLEQNIPLSKFHSEYDKDYSIYCDDGVTKLPENTNGFILDSDHSGKPWYVSEKFFNKNYEILK